MKGLKLAGALACAASLCSAAPALAATEVVTEATVTRQVENTPPTDNWVLYTRAGTPATAGAFEFGPAGSLSAGSFATRTATGAEKVFLFNYDHVGTPLGDIDDLSYDTYRVAGNLQQAPALNLQIDYNGAAPGGFSTLVFEPVYNTDQGTVTSGVWQSWNGKAGTWWSTQPINGQCAGATAACDKTWAEIVANNPDAVIGGGVGINQGSGNPSLDARTDAFAFDETLYDFEPVISPATKDDCKNGGWQQSNTPVFKNQGDCVSSFAPGKNK